MNQSHVQDIGPHLPQSNVPFLDDTFEATLPLKRFRRLVAFPRNLLEEPGMGDNVLSDFGLVVLREVLLVLVPLEQIGQDSAQEET